MTELRRALRESTYKAARIGAGSMRAALHCGVRNLSDTGACLRLDDAQAVPDSFHLVFDSGEPSRQCRVVWRNARQLGVRFE
jgi:PilZ domain-containing protein